MKIIDQRLGILFLGYCAIVLSGCGFVKEIEANKKRIAELERSITDLTKDQDGDGIVDSRDLEPDTPTDVEVDTRGQARDTDRDGVPDHKDSDPFSDPGIQVDSSGLALDSDGDGVPDNRDDERNTTTGAKVDHRGVEIEEPIYSAPLVKPSWNLSAPPYAYLPDFNLAPPTDTEKLNDILINVGTIGGLCSMVENACEKANLKALNYAEIPGVGFALISTGHRYSPINGFNDSAGGYGLLEQPQFSFLEALEAIRYKVKGEARFRYFVFVIGFDWEKFNFNTDKVANTEALNLLLKPNKGLPESVLNHKITDGMFVQAIIYEFEVSGPTGTNVMLTPTDRKSFSVKDHLIKSGIAENLKP